MNPILIKQLGTKIIRGNAHTYALFTCGQCGNEFEATNHDIKTGRKKHCGCTILFEPLPDTICGLAVVKDLGRVNGRGVAVFQCMFCPNTFEAVVSNVKAGKHKGHCGCYVKPKKEKVIVVKEKPVSIWQTEPYRHLGYDGPDGEHPLYELYRGIVKRCYNKNNHNYHNYGGRGIRMCDRWRNSFHDWLVDMGPRPSKGHSIDRIDNDGIYEPSNCKWSTAKEQNANTRANTIKYPKYITN